MSKPREKWRQFKKTYPDFEKDKRFKSNFGPLCDQAEAFFKQFDALLHDYIKKLKEAQEIASGKLTLCVNGPNVQRTA